MIPPYLEQRSTTSLRVARTATPKRLVTLCAVVLGAVLASADARADEPQAPAAPAEDPERLAEARKHFEAGVNLLDDPDGAKYEDAYRSFKKAYAILQSPKVLGNIGFCAMHLERDGEAIDSYKAYLRDVPDVDPRERAQIERDLSTLTSTVAHVTIKVKHPGTSFVVLDTRIQTRGAPVENIYPIEGNEVTLRVRPGRHRIRVKSADAESTPIETIIEPASSVEHEAVFPPPKPPPPPPPAPVIVERPVPVKPPSTAGPLVLGAAGVLTLGVGVATGLVARGKTNDIESRCPNDTCPADYDDFLSDRTSAKTFATIADVTFIAGGALVGGAVLWYVLLPKGNRTGTRSSSSPTWTPSATCTAHGCGLDLRRTF